MNRFLVLLAVGAGTASTSLLGVNNARAQSSTSDTAYRRTLIAAYQHYGHARQAVPLGVAVELYLIRELVWMHCHSAAPLRQGTPPGLYRSGWLSPPVFATTQISVRGPA